MPDSNTLLRHDRAKAIGLVIVAVVMFSCLDATVKYIVSTTDLPLSQVVWLRFFCQFLFVVAALGMVSLPRLLRTQRLKHQVARSVLMLLSTLCNFLALRHLRLDQTTTINFLAPLTVALLAGPVLGEWVGWRRMVAIMVGFAGVLVAIRPGFGGFHPAFLPALGCMFAYAGFILLTRYLAAYDTSDVTLFYSMLIGAVVMAPLAMIDWVWPADAFTWMVLLSLGFWAGLGHYVFIVAHRWAPASVLSPFIYVQLLSVTACGYLIFGDLPDLWTLIGSAIIVASGIYLLQRERSVHKQEVKS